MGRIYKNGIDYTGGNANVLEVTKAEYNALPDSKNSDGVVYALMDAEADIVKPIEAEYDAQTKTVSLSGAYESPNNYSTEEQVIGTWFGKPLYQKSFTNLSIPINAETNWQKIKPNGMPQSIDFIIDAKLLGEYNIIFNYEQFDYDKGSESFEIITPVHRTLEILTIQYTKTTE